LFWIKSYMSESEYIYLYERYKCHIMLSDHFDLDKLLKIITIILLIVLVVSIAIMVYIIYSY
jgi:uncharacterized membrane protein